MTRLADALNNKTENYIFPFLWLHGEDKKTLLGNIHKIYDSGVKAFCLESRPHPDFLGDRWWQDLDIILNEAKSLGMKVWILDDSHFPTGFANGKVKNDLPQYLKKYLYIKQLDFRGPQQDATIILKYLRPDRRFQPADPNVQQPEKILKVIAAKKIGNDKVDANSLVDITDSLKDGLLNWNVPDGEWRIFTLIETIHGGEKETEGYLNPLVSDATKVLLNEVYKPHYEHYKEMFGNVIAGFFSDEPRFGNHHGAESRLGIDEMVLPWRDGMLEEFFNDDYLQLPLLTTVSANGQEKKIRYKYMNLVSKLYSHNFTKVLCDWCHEHEVNYIGHLIEDNGSHTRLGYGAGHYFRALDAQDMAGIDVVLNQIMPGMDNTWFKSMTGAGWNCEFFNYGLAKMGASLGHLDPKKHGRVMSEVFGAYGWAEGLTLMKFIADHMIVRGVNHFVPHAFNPNKFPDPDCPPHFYSNGHEPENRAYSELFNYMNRLSHILSGGQHIAHVAVLYHAEDEWLDKDAMPFEKPVKVLMQNQIDCEITPLDYLKSANIQKSYFEINHEKFDTLIIPETKYVPYELLGILKILQQNDIKLLFINNYPEQDESLNNIKDVTKTLGTKIGLKDIPYNLTDKDIFVKADTVELYLRFYNYQNEDDHLLMFLNEDPSKVIDTTLTIKEKFVYQYDAMTNSIKNVDIVDGKYQLNLAPGQSIVLIKGNNYNVISNNKSHHSVSLEPQNITLSLASAESYPNFESTRKLDQLKSINLLDGLREFSGNMKYSFQFNLDKVTEMMSLDLGTVNEVATVKLNGHPLGTRIAYPYQFDDISKFLKVGVNEVEIIVVNNLGIKQQDFLSQYMLIKPAGLLGPINIKY